jgi:hypothetical protein
MKKTAFLALWALLASACSDGAKADVPDAIAPPPDAGHAEASPPDTRFDAAAADTRDGGGGDAAGDGGGGGGDAAPMAAKCSDVSEPGFAPFEAIRRLATTGEEVRVLVYGQSISEQVWWQEVRDWLRAQYPGGRLVMEEHARGGCAAQCLIGREAWFLDGQTSNRVPGDVFAWNPHLIIFNVTGRHDDYETLIKGFKQGCSAFDDHPVASARCRPSARFPDYKPAEVLIQTAHRVNDVDYRDRLPMVPPVPEDEWEYWMSTVWIPGVARRHGATVVPVWERWWDYLQANKLKATDLLIDGVHLNDAGNKLMAALTKRFLCYVPR